MTLRIFAIVLLVLLTCKNLDDNWTEKIPPQAIQGVLVLRNWDINRDRPVELKGEWEFYWKEFVDPGKTEFTLGLPVVGGRKN
jgi:hypothetical protein